jgi:ribosomal protein S27E
MSDSTKRIKFKCKICGKENDRDPKDVLIDVDTLESEGRSSSQPRYFIKCDRCGNENVITRKAKQ